MPPMNDTAHSETCSSLRRFLDEHRPAWLPCPLRMIMRWGILLAALGVVCYIVPAVLLNRYLQKHVPEVLARDPGVPSQRQSRASFVRGVTPRWVTLLGLPAIPVFLLGIAFIAVSCPVAVLR